MKHTLRLLVALVALVLMAPIQPMATAQVPAFPTADGYAKYTTGGRGGRVLYVTRLDDCTDNDLVPGTLRWALRSGDDMPRTILFAVHGTIYLTSKLKTNHPNVSILGQSAPGGGICITGFPLYVCSQNYVLRYLRFRAGDVPDQSLTGLDIENAQDVILDHCSMTWSMEECLTMFDVKRTTVQWCIIGEGLYNSKNSKGARAYATQWGGEQTTMHHTLITNSHSRSPRFNGVRLYSDQNTAHTHDYQVDSEFANNVIYNWSSYNSIYGGENNGAFADEYNRVYMVSNYYRPGPSTQHGTTSRRYWVAASAGENSTGSTTQTGQWYLSGNKFETSSKWAPKTNIWNDAELAKVNADNLYGYDDNNASRAMGYWSLTPSPSLKAKSIIDASYYNAAKSEFNAETADAAFQKVVNQAGASLPRYDEVDQRLLDEAAGRRDPQFIGSIGNGEYGIIDSPSDITLTQGTDAVTVGGVTYRYCPSTAMLAGEKYAVDMDGDGMPDDYEATMGLDRLDPADGSAVATNGYTNLENYMNGLADGTLRAADYQSSDTYVEPGQGVRPETVTLTFVRGDEAVEGILPQPVVLPYGATWCCEGNSSLYRAGHTMTGWTDGSATYLFGKDYTWVADATLRPAMEVNTKELADRTDDVTVRWDFTRADAPALTPGTQGLYVTHADLDGTALDVALRYEGMTLTLPAVEGAVATVITAGGMQEYAAVDNQLTLTVGDRPSLREVSVVLPYVFDPTGIVFHTPAVGTLTTSGVNSGSAFSAERAKNYEVIYCDTLTLDAQPWMQTLGQRRNAYRNCISPMDDDHTYCDGLTGTQPTYGFVVGSSTTSVYKLVAYVRDCARVRTYLSGSSSLGDQMLLQAIPADGSERLMASNLHVLSKSGPFSETFDLELDPAMQYMLLWSSSGGNDMMVGGIRLYDKTGAGAATGDATVVWNWPGTADVQGATDPAKAFASATATVGSGFGTVAASVTADDQPIVTFKPAYKAETRDAEQSIAFCIRPAAGYTFQPQRLSFYGAMSAEASNLDIYVQEGDGEEQLLAQYLPGDLSRTVTLDLSHLAASRQPLTLRFYCYNLVVKRLLSLRAIRVEGQYANIGLPKHRLTTQVTPAGAGVVSQSPKGTTFVEGAEVTLSATAVAGYAFTGWSDSQGHMLATTPRYVYTMGEADETLTANFRQLDGSIFRQGPVQAVVETVAQLTDALLAAQQSGAERYVIFLHNGTYDLGATAMTAIPARTSLVGESQEGVLICNNPGLIDSNYQDKTPTLYVAEGQDDVYLQDLTIRQGRDWEGRRSQGQALAMRQRGKRAVYKNVTMQGVQDTYYLNKADASAYLEGCTVAGNVDYLYGDGTCWLECCTIQHVGTGGYIVAPNTKAGDWGFVFNACVVQADASAAGTYHLGRPWDDSPHATFLSTTFCTLPAEAGWARMTDGLTVRFHEFASKDAQGSALDLSKRSIAACNAAAASDQPVLTAEQAAAYTVPSVLPGWEPQQRTAQLSPGLLTWGDGRLSWPAVEGARGYAIVCDGAVVDFTTATRYAFTGDASRYRIRVLNACGGLGPQSDAASLPGVSADAVATDAEVCYDLFGRRVAGHTRGPIIRGGKLTIEN